jgi:hypothetical protein
VLLSLTTVLQVDYGPFSATYETQKATRMVTSRSAQQTTLYCKTISSNASTSALMSPSTF